MIKPKILVTGATGKTGAAVVAQLREKGFPVRAAVHKLDARSQALADLGAEVVVCDLYDPDLLVAAATGTQRAYYCPPVQPYMIQSAVAFALAAQEAKLESVVALTQWLSSKAHPALLTRQHWLVDQLFSTIPGVASTIVNPGLFAEPLMMMLPGAANMGTFPNPFGDGKLAPVSNEDMARVVVGALLDPARHAGKTYHPTGPKVLSVEEIVAIVGRVLDRKVSAMPVSPTMFNKAMRSMGTSAFEVAITSHYAEEVRRGTFEYGSPSDDIFTVAGTRAEDFETTVRRYASHPNVQKSLGNQVRAVWDFARLIMTRPYDLESYVAEQGQPTPPHPELAVDSKTWHEEHASWGKRGASLDVPPVKGVGANDRQTYQEVAS